MSASTAANVSFAKASFVKTAFVKKHRTMILLSLLALAGAGACYWLWITYFEKAWVGMPYQSDAAANDPMLAANRFLTAEGYTVVNQLGLATGFEKDSDTNIETSSAATVPGIKDVGTIFLANNEMRLNAKQAQQLLNWVQAGGVLIMMADWQMDSPELARDLTPLSAPFHTWRQLKAHNKDHKNSDAEDEEQDDQDENNSDQEKKHENDDENQGAKKAAELLGINTDPPQRITPPGSAYALEITGCGCPLLIEKSAPPSLWVNDDNDSNRKFINVYAHGRGRMVLLNSMPFYNHQLPVFDNAEFLLRLVQLQTTHLPIWFVNNVDMPKWYVVLWQHVPMAMLALIAGLLLWFWSLLPRFGPMLPLPSIERRALLDHIDASARWLWLRPRGRAILLEAMRSAVINKLREHHYALRALTAEEMIGQILAQPHKYFSKDQHFSRAQLEHALLASVATHSAAFSQQIHFLQTLRNAYERKH